MGIQYFNQRGTIPDLSELDRLRDLPEKAHRLARMLADYDPSIYIRKLGQRPPF